MSEPCPLCGREKLKDRVQRAPRMREDPGMYCLHPSHICDREMPPCEARGLARLKAALYLPNGWKQPTFLSVDDDGGLTIEWCFGGQGASDSERVMFTWDPKEGVMACRTTRDHQTIDRTVTAGTTLARLLGEATKRETKAAGGT
jgi:hypothetical protein